MYLQRLLWALSLIFLLSTAFVHDGSHEKHVKPFKFHDRNFLASRRLRDDPHNKIEAALPRLHKRLQPEQQLFAAIGLPGHQRSGLFIPMLYVGYMGKNRLYDRYQCDATAANDAAQRRTGTATAVGPVILTSNLASCVAIHVISPHGTILAHLPPAVCTVINDPSRTSNAVLKRMASLMKSSSRTLLSRYLATMGGASRAKTVAVLGPTPEGTPTENIERIRQVVEAIFPGLVLNAYIPMPTDQSQTFPPPDPSERTTTVDMSGNEPVFYVGNTVTPLGAWA